MLKKFNELHEDIKLSKERLKICKECEYLIKTMKLLRCKKCGCLLEVKTMFSSSECPINKW